MNNLTRTSIEIVAILWCCVRPAGCGTTYPEDLAALRADPMAGVELPGGELFLESTTDASAGTKRTFATYTASYRPDEGVTTQELLDEAVAAATESGWDMDAPGETSVEGTKQLETGDARISIASRDRRRGSTRHLPRARIRPSGLSSCGPPAGRQGSSGRRVGPADPGRFEGTREGTANIPRRR